MITKVVLAKLSPTMEEGTVVSWSKQEGDEVKVGDVLAEIETDKANMEMEALGAGTLRKILVPAGVKAPVGALIGVIADEGEDIEPLIAAAKASAPAETETAPKPKEAPPAPAEKAAAPPPAPARPAPTAATPRPAPTTTPGGRIKASPLARAIASRKGVPLEDVPGSGPGGRIIKRDVEGYLESPPAAATSARGARPGDPPLERTAHDRPAPRREQVPGTPLLRDGGDRHGRRGLPP
jgi:pyruvate dehydrogenase E2 component (dihydrolipoamide acetyltransferase)